jgi:methanogenic corrinoid protein MtbC1
MDAADRSAADALDQVQSGLVEWCFSQFCEDSPAFLDRYPAQSHRLWRQEIRQRLRHLAEAIACRCPELFLDDLHWSREAFQARMTPIEDLRQLVASLRGTIEERLPDAIAHRALPMIDEGLRRLAAPSAGQVPSLLDPPSNEDPDTVLARRYLLHLLQREQQAAIDLVLDVQRRGRPTAEIYERVLMPALVEIGRMWHLQEASIADEHFCTAATRLAMAELRAAAPRQVPHGRSVLCTAVGGDLHDLGVRMVSDLFELAGWHSECLGADMPIDEIAAALRNRPGPGPVPHRGGYDLLALSANTPLVMRPLTDLISTLRTGPAGLVRVLVGGRPFRTWPQLGAVVGADGSAHSASAAIELAEAWFADDRIVHARG